LTLVENPGKKHVSFVKMCALHAKWQMSASASAATEATVDRETTETAIPVNKCKNIWHLKCCQTNTTNVEESFTRSAIATATGTARATMMRTRGLSRQARG